MGGYYNTDLRDDLVIRERSYEDNAIPAANGIGAANLVRLFLSSEDTTYLDRTEQTLQAFGQVMQQAPQSCPSLFAALDWFRQMTLVRTGSNWIPALANQYLPTVLYSLESALPAEAIALVCQGLSCQEPAQSAEQLQMQLQQSLTRR